MFEVTMAGEERAELRDDKAEAGIAASAHIPQEVFAGRFRLWDVETVVPRAWLKPLPLDNFREFPEIDPEIDPEGILPCVEAFEVGAGRRDTLIGRRA